MNNNPLQRLLENWSKLELTLLGIFVALLTAAVVLFAVLGSIFFGNQQPSEVSDLVTTEPTTGGPSLSLSPSVGSAGSTVTVQGDGWPVGSHISIYFVPITPPRYVVNSAIVDPQGSFSVDIIVPSDPRWLNESPVPVLAQTDDERTSAQALLTISSPADIPALTPSAPDEVVPPPEPEPTATPPPPSVAQLTVNTDLNVRSGPGVQYDIIGVLLYGQSVEITGRNADGTWWQILYPSARSDYGWVSAQFATAENIENVPIVTAPPAPTVAPTPQPTATPVPGIVITEWRGEYYNNRNLSGDPVLVRNDVAVSFDWGENAPAPELPADNFSARWTRQLDFSAGAYRFYVRADDGVRLWVDDNLLIDEWRESAPATYSRDIYLTSGAHNIRMEYFEATGGALAILGWERIDTFPDWKAEYYNNRDLMGSPVLVRNEPSINYNWGEGSPADVVQDNDFSVRWTRRLNFEAGDYILRVRSDDGMRVWVDNAIIYDNWQDGDSGVVEIEHNINGGVRDLRVEYYERTGTARAEVWWERQDDEPDNPPLAVISSPSEGEVDQPIKFDGSRSRRGDNPIIDYEWEFGDGKESDGKEVNHTYTSPGTYRVRLTVRDSAGLTDRTTVDIDIEDDLQNDTPPIAVIDAPSAAQVGEAVSFDGSRSQSANTITSYIWNFGDGTSANGKSVRHTFQSPGLYSVNLTLVDDKGLRGSTNTTVRINEEPAPVAVISAPDTATVGEVITVNASGSTSENGIVKYDWDFGDGWIAGGVTTAHAYDSPAFYNLRLTVTDQEGLSNTTNKIIQVEGNTSPTAVVSATPSATTPAATETVAATTTATVSPSATTAPTLTITMTPTEEVTATTTVTATVTTTPTPTVTATSEATATATITPTATPTLTPTATSEPTDEPLLIAVISGPSSAQEGQTVTFSAGDSLSSVPITLYSWQLGDGTQANGANVTHVYTTAGVYPIQLTLTNLDILTDTAQDTIQIEAAAPSAPPMAVISGPSSVVAGEVVTLTASASQSSTPITSYQWSLGDGTLATGMTITHTYTTTGIYTSTLTITNQDSLTDTTSNVIEVIP